MNAVALSLTDGPRRPRGAARHAALLALLLAMPYSSTPRAAATDPAVSVDDHSREAYSRPLPGLDDGERARFEHGRSLFRQAWVVAPASDERVDGLGPLYNRLTCIACHPKNGHGQAPAHTGARMQSMLIRLSVPGRDAHGGPRPHPVYGDQLNEEGIPGVPGEGRAVLHWETHEVALADGERVELRQPRVEFRELAYGALDGGPGGVRVSARVGPPVFGLGLLEAVAPQTLAALARETKPDGVRGRVNQVWHVERKRMEPGRFGLKANMPDLRQQIAGALLGDLGLTSPLFPEENCSPAQTACRAAPRGGRPEIDGGQLDALEFYFAHLAVPARRNADDPVVRRGEAHFAALGCASCHRPALRTGPHPRFTRLSGREIAPYTDLLVHDMGAGLADHRPDYLAGGREWRTPPLWGIGLVARINEHSEFLHDGRARNLTEAILWHGGEAQAARDRFAALDREARAALLAFLNSL